MKKIINSIVFLSILSISAFAAELKKLKVGTSTYPGAPILEQIREDLKNDGIDLEIVEMNDYVIPNIALAEGEIDLNSFQHLPYLEQFKKDKNLDIVSVGNTFVAPLGLYSKKYKKLEEIPEKATIAIPSDPTNSGRALILFHKAGLIKLKDPANLKATEFDIAENPKKITFKLIEAPQLPRVLPDVDAAIINGGYAVEAGLSPIDDSILLEDKDSPYVNVIAARTKDKDKEEIKKFVKHYQSEKVKEYILKEFKGAYIPVF